MPQLRTKIPNAKAGVDFEQSVGHRRYIIGMDVGARQDPSTFCIIKDEQIPLPSWGKRYRQEMGERRLSVVQAFRLKLKTSYSDQADFVLNLLGDPAFEEDAHLYVDSSGVGAAFCSLLDDRHISYSPVQITAGEGFSEWEHRKYRASKMWLLNKLSIALQSGELTISKGIADIEELRRQLEDFEVQVTATGKITANAKNMSHDDHILAMAIAYFGADNFPGIGFSAHNIRWG